MQTTTLNRVRAGTTCVPAATPASPHCRAPRISLVLACLALMVGCRAPEPGPWVQGDGYRWRELAVSGGEAGFDLVSPDRTGVDFQNQVSPERRLQNQLLTHGSGVAIGDVDGDGLPDVYLARVDGPDALYRNLGNWRFQDITESAGVALPDHDATGVVMADVDGDEDLDLYVGARGQPNALFLNDGSGHFTDVSSAAGVDYPGGTTTLTMADVDGDGDLDLYVANYKTVKAGNVFSPHERAFDQVVEKRGDDYRVADRYKDYYRLRFTPEGMTLWQFGEPDVLYLNDGSGTFTPASWTDGRFLEENGTPLDSVPDEWALTARFYDVDGDRAPDLYVSNDFESPDHFWMNQGDGTFRSVDGFEVRNTSASSMAVDFSDINRDGRTDFLVVDMFAKDPDRRRTQIPTIAPEVLAPGEAEPRLQHNRNTLFVARPDGTFEETAWAAGIEASGWSWSTLFMDVDLDGYEDALVTTGHVWDVLDADTQSRLLNTVMSEDWQEVIDEFPPLPLGNAAFRNRGDGTFEDAGQRWGFDLGPDISHGFATGDLDLDGDEDVVVNRLGYPAAFLKNHTAAPRIAVQLRGLAPNTHGIGATVRLLAPDFRQDKEIAAGGLYLSSSQAQATFAVPAEGPLSLVVDWRSGRTSVISDVQADRLYEIDEAAARTGGGIEPEGTTTRPALPDARVPLFTDASAELDHTHAERPYNDFDRQPLLPFRLSQMGPGVTWSDIDQDGDPDLTVTSGVGGRLAVFRNQGGSFEPVAGGPRADAFDQTAVLPLPGELLVGQSNYEAPTPREAQTAAGGLRVRLSGGRIAGVTDAVEPAAPSVGPLAAADLDGDGALEVFVGSRTFPAAYPERPASRLYHLRADGTLEPDSAADMALAEAGLVSAAVFTDIDADGDADLALATDWGPVRIYLNHLGRLTDVTNQWGLGALTGRWNGIDAGDLDGDGRMDLVVTSWGRNTNRHPTPERPLELYWGDFDGRGALDLLEAMPDPETGEDRPETDLARLSTALPYVRVREVRTFAEFSTASVADVLGENAVKRARVERIVTLDHQLLLNRGGRFEATPLPLEAQLAPAFAPVVADMDGDGHEDVVLAQNFFPNEVNLQRFDAGRGLLLLGDGAGNLTPVAGSRSGIIVYGDQRGAAAADYDGDGRTDLVIAQNAGSTVLLHNQGAEPGLRVRVQGPAGNPRGAGARVRLVYGDGSMGPAREIHLGSGYWSVDGAVQVLGRASGMEVRAVEVTWPGGAVDQVPVPAGADEVVVRPETGR